MKLPRKKQNYLEVMRKGRIFASEIFKEQFAAVPFFY
jgi:hypothetical protein